MRGFVTLVVAVLVSGFIAGVVQMQIGIAYDAQEELIVAMVGEVVLVVFAGAMFGIAMLVSGVPRSIDLTAAALAAVIVIGVGALEWFTLASEPQVQFARDVPVLVEIGVPALLTIALQWWIVRRHITKAGRAAPAVA